jgi:hypothetical protein
MDPWKELGTRNWVPGRRPPAVRPNSGELLAKAGPGAGGDWPLGPKGDDSGAWLWRGRVGEVGRRRPAAVAAAACCASDGGSMQGSRSGW